MIEDDPEAILLMGIRLKEACGQDMTFMLEGAETLQKGLLLAENGDYDVILLDLHLPDSRGLETILAARRKAGGKPIVVMTGFEDENMALEAIALGAQDYLIKDRLNITLLRRAILFAIERSGLLRQARELESLRAEVRERQKTIQFKNRLLGAASHELRSPLTVAQTAVENLAEGMGGPLTPEQKELLDMARRNLDRLGRLVMNALDYSRLDSGRASTNPRRVDARRLVGELTSDWKRSLSRPLRVDVDIPADLPPVRADADMLAQVICNLCDNAARHARTAVRVSAKVEGDAVRLTVEDDGPGVPPERAGEIFKPFTQVLRGEGPGYHGTGLGLTICREIAALSRGRIWLEPGTGAGARFHFELPRWRAEAPAGSR